MRVPSSQLREKVKVKAKRTTHWLTVLGFYLACLLAVVALSRYLVSVEAVNAYNPDNLIRLHVIGDGETYEDQVIKYRIRDVVLKRVANDLAGVADQEEATRLLLARIPEIQEACRSEVRKCGKHYGVKVDLVDAHLPGRVYGALDLPEGRYRTMRVTLGRGRGSNWWCVLFPPLCFVDIATSGGLSGASGGITAADLTDAGEVAYNVVARPSIAGNPEGKGLGSEKRIEPIVLLNGEEVLVRTEIRFALLDALAKLIPHKTKVAKVKPDNPGHRP